MEWHNIPLSTSIKKEPLLFAGYSVVKPQSVRISFAKFPELQRPGSAAAFSRRRDRHVRHERRG